MSTQKLNEGYTVTSGRYTIEVIAEPLEIEIDPAELIEPVAHASAEAVGQGIASNSEQVAPGTLKKRRSHGSTSTRLGVDTGRLAAGVHAERRSDGSYEIMPPPDRLNPSDFSSPEAYERFRERLAEAVPAIADPLSPPTVEDAIVGALDKAVK